MEVAAEVPQYVLPPYPEPLTQHPPYYPTTPQQPSMNHYNSYEEPQLIHHHPPYHYHQPNTYQQATYWPNQPNVTVTSNVQPLNSPRIINDYTSYTKPEGYFYPRGRGRGRGRGRDRGRGRGRGRNPLGRGGRGGRTNDGP